MVEHPLEVKTLVLLKPGYIMQVVLVEVGLEAWSCGHASPGAAPQPPLPTSTAGAGSAADERADGGRGRSTSIYDSHEPEQEEPTFV